VSADATISAMRKLGFSDAQILSVVEQMEKDRKEAARKANADRQARWRMRNSNNDSNGVTRVTRVTRDIVTDESPYKENHARADGNPNPLTTFEDNNITPLPTVSPPAERKSKSVMGPQAILETVFSPQTAAELIAHRRSKREPLTEGAAKRLVKAVTDWGGDPEAAASEMMLRGWTGFKGEWMQPSARAGPASRQQQSRGGGVARMLKESLERTANARTAETSGFDAPLGLPFDGGAGGRPDGGDDGGISRPDIQVLVGGAVRRM
jgi:hypothetical protein